MKKISVLSWSFINGKINYNTLKSVLFEFPTYHYLKTGDVLCKCLSVKDKNPKEETKCQRVHRS